jgi:hypothetical protein
MPRAAPGLISRVERCVLLRLSLDGLSVSEAGVSMSDVDNAVHVVARTRLRSGHG